MMRSAYYCTAPFHADSDLPSQAPNVYYLVTSPLAKAPGPGVYPSWSSAQRVAEKVPRGGGVRFSSYDACLPGWYACCDAGEHDHPPNPESQSRQSQPSSPSPAHRSTQGQPTPATPAKSLSIAQIPAIPATLGTPAPSYASVPSTLVAPSTSAPADPVEARLAAVHAVHYAVCGGGIVHSALTPALAQYHALYSSTGDATLFTSTDARHTAHVAAGHSIPLAKELADRERAAAQVKALGPTPHLARTSSTRHALAQQLRASLRQLDLLQREEIMVDNELWGTFEDHGGGRCN
ncbi:hypothetical protein B0H17DRAFT_1202693 [Mycena rosella]|uniref:Uncharacterized protein n=1 Tax=Mycena rosella TaxID=1033263 RepID=A0AAD7DD42_MYCRO|nr:hypothetical protein B0H17DRAFT_1202693 [Mycena rosella]